MSADTRLSAGRAQDLVDVDALRESNQDQEIERQQRPAPPVTNELDQIKKGGCEDWLRQREKKGSQPTLEELRAKGREDWLKLRQYRTRESSRELQDRSAERDQDAKPKDLPASPDKGLDDDLN